MAGVEDVWPPVAETAPSEFIPAAPFLWVELGAEWTLRCDHIIPLIPVDTSWHWILWVFRYRGTPTMPASLLIHVRGDPSDVLDDACLTPGFELKIVRAGVPLVTHLCGDAATSREIDHALALAKCMGKGLFTVNVFAERHRKHSPVSYTHLTLPTICSV